MPTKKNSAVGYGGSYQKDSPYSAGAILKSLAAAENRPVVVSIGAFAMGVAFLHSSWSEILLPA